MRKFKNFKYNKVKERSTEFPYSLFLTETFYIKDLKYGRKISLIEECWNDKDSTYGVSYYDKKSKKGKHVWYLLCYGCSLEETIEILNKKIAHWKKCDYLNHI